MIVNKYENIIGLNPVQNFLVNRGIPIDKVNDYIAANISDLDLPELLGIKNLNRAIEIISEAIESEKDVYMIVDGDADGYLSSALFINYLHNLYPTFTEEHIKYSHHEGKIHGLIDVIDEALNYEYIIAIDSSSNDIEQHKALLDNNSKIVILDHHIVDITPIESEDIVIINNQYSDYPNKDFCGAGITYLFCKYMDKIFNVNYADNYLDLASVATVADMMNMANPHTKGFIFEGLKEENIKNPFIKGLIEKNKFSLDGSDYIPPADSELYVSPIGVGFFVSPFINAITRSGTQEEKFLIFESMLEFKSFTKVDSTKRGEKGKQEFLVTQAVRTIGNVKRRQDDLVKKGMEYLENMIAENHMLENNILVFLLDKDIIPPSICGLAANKLMNKYNRCVSVFIKQDNDVYTGSCRGCNIPSYKDWLLDSGLTLFTAGHHSALGASIKRQDYDALINLANNDSSLIVKPQIYVDYYWTENEINDTIIKELSKTNIYIGTGINKRPSIYIENILVNENNIQILGQKKNTLKITSKNGIDLMMFGIDEEYVNSLINNKINILCKPNVNIWNGNVKSQLIIEELEINKDISTVEAWGF